ncbi:MAG: hypothetical protein DBY42_07290 [Bacillota bacterium]|nr:MAG: hypothetical protein DBY42_07290 [Bacillota bacterium]
MPGFFRAARVSILTHIFVDGSEILALYQRLGALNRTKPMQRGTACMKTQMDWSRTIKRVQAQPACGVGEKQGIMRAKESMICL